MLESLDDRLRRFEINADVKLSPAADGLRGQVWLALTSSHLGKSTRLHAQVCRYISRAMIDARQAGRVVLVAAGSAIEPWAMRAADLFAVPMIRVAVNEPIDEHSADLGRALESQPRIEVRADDTLCRDTTVVALADRVDCVFCRPRGNVQRSLRTRLQRDHEPTIRIAIHDDRVDKKAQRTARALMDCGAVGWYCCPHGVTDPSPTDSAPIHSSRWALTRGEWLVHCTRSSQGPWPGQTDRQHRDALLLGGPASATAERTPLDSLERIIRMRRLVASAIASDRAWPVVCFSEQSLGRLLAERSYRSHLHRWDYEPYGVAIRKSAAIAAGFQPVIYGTAKDRRWIPPRDQFRFQAVGKTYDWTRECEWRIAGDVDLDRFDRRDVRVFVANQADVGRVAGRFAVSVVG
ncbi:hypothetical protein Mal15_67960 [Stieleria maiorica]|uniref:Uncharacterized protein n=1 Tax=Stieleria maiorica TaxID=2795974 RepID=A0A5B9MRX6_9BACT|nr:hypothetical protein [Stieleria maiorica]QEG02675.1 hypothetical protein Mal15_67960 [Stieleria maiorica]